MQYTKLCWVRKGHPTWAAVLSCGRGRFAAGSAAVPSLQQSPPGTVMLVGAQLVWNLMFTADHMTALAQPDEHSAKTCSGDASQEAPARSACHRLCPNPTAAAFGGGLPASKPFSTHCAV